MAHVISAVIDHSNLKVEDNVYQEQIKPMHDKALNCAELNDDDDLVNVKFCPEKHLRYYAGGDFEQHRYNTTRRLSMEELGLVNKNQISHIGVSDPFPLFTDQAIAIMKAEITERENFLKYARYNRTSSTSGLDCIMRGYAIDKEVVVTKFTYEAWTHPKTTELISRMAGVELEIVMDYEIAHVNFAMKTDRDSDDVITKARERAHSGVDDGSEMPAVVQWHYDSYPFVCVLMLSDTSDMIGGETSLRMGASDDGSKKVASVPGPQLGHAAILQGRLIEHIAAKPIGGSERITMVTSYRARDPSKLETSVLSTVKPEVASGSRSNDFYPQWVKYRTQLLKQRFDVLNSTMYNDEGNFDKQLTMDNLKEMTHYLEQTYKQMELSAKDIKQYHMMSVI